MDIGLQAGLGAPDVLAVGHQAGSHGQHDPGIAGDGQRPLEQAHLVLGFEGASFHSRDHYSLHVFSNLLGGGMSSRLFQEIREKRGLCYEIYSFHQPFSDTGAFAVYGGTGEDRLGEFMPVLLDCLREAAERPTETEVARAKAQIKVSLLMGLSPPPVGRSRWRGTSSPSAG